MINILFVCGRNKWRSPTAEHIFANYPGIECTSAGLSHDAENPLSSDQVSWADIIFVMERSQKAKLSKQFQKSLSRAKIICLDIPDKYKFMDPELVLLLQSKVTRWLPKA